MARYEDEDEEILDNEFDALLELATDEIQWRAEVLGAFYPFTLQVNARSWTLRYRRQGDASTRIAQDVYSTCLLMSSIRHSRLDGLPANMRAVKTVADAFQAAVFLVAPALLGGPSFWIAFPRPEKDDYAPALGRLVKELGVGVLSEKHPPSQTRNKDGGVDIVTWRTFPDHRSNIMLSYGQVATGKRWRDKSVKNKLESHFLKWLAERPVTHPLPAMYIPHVMHEDLTAGPGDVTFEELAQDDAHTLEASLGVVVDRMRMTVLAAEAFRIREVGNGRGISHIRTLQRWKRAVVDAMRQS